MPRALKKILKKKNKRPSLLDKTYYNAIDIKCCLLTRIAKRTGQRSYHQSTLQSMTDLLKKHTLLTSRGRTAYPIKGFGTSGNLNLQNES